MKTLLVLVKSLVNSEKYIEYSLKLAADLKYNVQIFYVHNPKTIPLASPQLDGAAIAQLNKASEERVREAIRSLSAITDTLIYKIAGQVIVEVTAAIGDEISMINEKVDSGDVQMVMIESQGIRSFSLQESFSKEVIRKVNCPVWVIPENSDYNSILSVIYATDYNEEDIPTLKKLIDLTYFNSPKISAIHITDNVDFDLRIKNAGFQKMLESKVEYENIEVKALVENHGDDMVGLINTYAARTSADLIVVLKENRRFLERLFKPGSSEKIIGETNRPVLVFHV
ncbi:MAG: universal stress protein [Bacteroidota bacterium]|nr:universal stress protein [Bacteroidota bacterium]